MYRLIDRIIVELMARLVFIDGTSVIACSIDGSVVAY